MQKHIRNVGLLGVALATLAACGPANTAFRSEAGAEVDSGYFGNATLNNAMVHTGQQGFVLDLANRFATEVPSTVNFAFDSAVLDEEARVILRRQAQWIRQFPEVRFRVYGHTDLVGSAAYNRSLGLRRAQAVVHFLISQGIERGRLEAVASFGDTQPLIATPDRERRNRRTVTEVTGFVTSNPLVMDGKYAQIVYRDYVESGVVATTLTDSLNAGEE